MSEAFENKTVITDMITKELSKYATTGLAYDFEEVMVDAADAVAAYKTSINIDKRVIAVGADLYIHLWDPYSSMQDGWKERMFISGGIYAQMLIDIGKPQKALFSTPDRHFDTVALCAERGVELYFLNNDSLFNFENFIRDIPSYPFTFNYGVIDYQDFIEDNDLTFDFIQMFSSDFNIDIELVDPFVSKMSSGGFGYISAANEEGRLYSEDYFIEPIASAIEIINSKPNIFSYHIPNALGFHVVTKV